jgi:hypothetical protein
MKYVQDAVTARIDRVLAAGVGDRILTAFQHFVRAEAELYLHSAEKEGQAGGE